MKKKAKKYFKEDIDSIEKEEKSKEETLVDEIIEAEYNKLIEKTIKSRAFLLRKCDNIFIEWKDHFKKELTEEFKIHYSEHSILDDDIYPSIPRKLEVYLNDTYDSEKRRIHVHYKNVDEEDPFDYIQICIWTNYY